MLTGPEYSGFIQPGETVVFLGDSITEDPSGYVSICAEHLPGVRVVNAGISGNKANEMLARLDSDVLSANPDWLLISAGINDVWHGFYDFEREQPLPQFDQARGLPLTQFKNSLRAMLIRAKEARIVLVSPTAIGDDPTSRENRMLAEYVETMKGLAEAYAAIYCPMHESYWRTHADAPDVPLTTDGVHMTQAGAEMMARTVLQCLGQGSQ